MNIWKLFPFLLITAIGALLLGYYSFNLASSYEIIFEFTNFLNVLLWLAIAITLFLFGLISSIVLIRDIKLQVVIAIASSVTLLSGFVINLLNSTYKNYSYEPLPLLVFFLFVVVGILTSVHNTNKSYYNLIKLNLGNVFSTSGKTILFFLAVAISLTFYINNNNAQAQEKLTNELVNYISKTTSTIMKTTMQNQVNAIIDNTEKNINSKTNQVVNSQIDDLLKNLPNSELLSDLLAQQTNNLSEQALNMAGDKEKDIANEQINNLEIEQMIEDQVKQIISPFVKYFAPFFALMLFFTINMTFGLVMLIAPLLSTVLIWLLKKVGYLKEEKEMVEVIRFKI